MFLRFHRNEFKTIIYLPTNEDEWTELAHYYHCDQQLYFTNRPITTDILLEIVEEMEKQKQSTRKQFTGTGD